MFGNHQPSLERRAPRRIARRRPTFRPGRHDIPSREVCGVEVEQRSCCFYRVIHEFSCDETFCGGFAFRLDYEVLMKDFAIASPPQGSRHCAPGLAASFSSLSSLLSFPCFNSQSHRFSLEMHRPRRPRRSARRYYWTQSARQSRASAPDIYPAVGG
jgi:hypothetical protein